MPSQDSPLASLPGYKHETLPYKHSKHGDLLVDIAYPDTADRSDATVVIHFHGGFLVIGDRLSFLPWWLVNLCVARKWIFVTPDYRLLPETTAQSTFDDAFDAYSWVLMGLCQRIGRQVGSVIVAGSSAGGYLALTAASRASFHRQPSALLLIYGMLDPANTRYTKPGSSVSGKPEIETGPVLEQFPIPKESHDGPVFSGQAIDGDPMAGPRGQFILALHQDALFPDYMTGIKGLSKEISSKGAEAIPEKHRNLFPLTFGELGKLPPTFLLHGKNDSAVPVELSIGAAEKLKAAGVQVHAEFPDDAEHGFDVRSGNIDVDKGDENSVPAFHTLKKVVSFLDEVRKDGFYDPPRSTSAEDASPENPAEDVAQLEQPDLD
ncbi:Alpha/Beta hydrolase protein [Thelonectria olida]|uniref:Alpha/Beta hydrolase protein n=1 Tax=Thelonectria olida TaxID=1576542 RepID=A0A9P8WIE5_9HYPO|nr:Alpha/Beta hydrolase protein [Thelonectria olida]